MIAGVNLVRFLNKDGEKEQSKNTDHYNALQCRPGRTAIRYPMKSTFPLGHEHYYDNLIPVYFRNQKEFPFVYNYTTNCLDDNNQIDLRWCCGDMPEEYEEQLKKQPKDWFWRDREVRYMCNWNGYRARDWEDYDWSESIVVLGCSMAYGVGVSNEHTFCHHLSKMMGRDVINLGVPAGSNELILSNLQRLIEHFDTPWAIVIAWTTVDRDCAYTHNSIDKMGPWNYFSPRPRDSFIDSDYVDDKKYYEVNFLENPYQSLGRYINTINITKTLAKSTGTRFVNFTWWENNAALADADFTAWFLDRARDDCHAGTESHEALSKQIYERLIDL